LVVDQQQWAITHILDGTTVLIQVSAVCSAAAALASSTGLV
jgi:hypothetical protein